MSVKALMTIGYEGSSLESFLDALVSLKVQVVVDVRELPLSRKPGFSKTPLAQALRARGIAYRHERSLGCPAEIRNRLRETGDYRRYFRDFNKYLAGQTTTLERLARELGGRVVLLCYERDVSQCHRRSVAERLRELLELAPSHIAVPA